MRTVLLATLLGVCCFGTKLGAQDKSAKAAATPPALQDLIVQGKLPEAVRIATKSPKLVAGALKSIMDNVDIAITERRIGEAKAAMEAVDRFVAALPKKGKAAPTALPNDAIQGRRARIAGIEFVDAKQYAEGETKLRQALELSKKAGDPVLEAGVHNNLGVTLRYQQSNSAEKGELAAAEFDTARKMAEEQNDLLRAGSYNFNLGQALLQLARPGAALEAFKRSAEQNKATGKTNLQARAIMFQGVSLSKIEVVSTEPVKYFEAAVKLFLNTGDNQNAGWSLFLMADHLAYGGKYNESASAGERALPYLVKANDKAGLLRCYNLLSDMYGRLDDKKRAESYKQKAAGLSK
jgi:tetratricopeptide (TPR) repeat protein